MHRPVPARVQLRLVLAGLLSLPLLVTGAVLQPAAAVSGPANLAPDSTTVSGSPVLSWDPVSGVTSYGVEVYDGLTKLTSATTVNTTWVPPVQLPTGHQLSWQVRGSGGVTTDWSTAAFTRATIGAPGLVSPVGGTSLDQPGDPLLYKWTAVPGATSYTVEVGPDPDFVDPNLVTSYTTNATQYSPNIIPADGHYYWRVTATLSSGVKSDRSTVEDYSVAAVVRSGGDNNLPKLPVYPANGQTIKDVALEWNPIDGASSYRLQISTDSNFLTLVADVSGIKSTRYSPPATLDNDQYWWRIAPVNADNFQTPFDPTVTPTWNFTRRWPDQAVLEYPADGASVGDPFYFQWTAVPLASYYKVQFSVNSSFTPSFTSCTTVHTTYTPGKSAGDCWPGAAGTYYWRVVAYDGDSDVVSETVNGQVHSFTYDPDLITLLAPSNGATVSVPTFSWQPFPNAAKYLITLTNTSNGSDTSKTVVGSTFTWTSKLTAGTYRWEVQPVFDDGRTGASILPGSQPTVTVTDPAAGVASTPEPVSVGSPSPLPPLLTWTSVANATNYKIQVRPNGSTGGWTYLTGTFAYPSGNDWDGTRMSPGTYEWRVEAYNGGTYLSTSLSSSIYTIQAFGTVSGYRAAITGSASANPASYCTAEVPANCQNLRQTPVLRWDPVTGAAYYKLLISHDVNLTNPVIPPVLVRGNNMWMDPDSLADADALTAYYWEVVPCNAVDVCASLTPAGHQFNKQGLGVQLSAPAPGATLPNDITFNWVDYLTTLQADLGTNSSLDTPSRTEAKQYRIQVSGTSDFTSLLDNKVVDQTTYTPYDRTYPEQQLYWRVQAIDGSGNALPWSATRTFTKSSPPPTLNSASTFAGSIALGWDPLAYAKTYTVQVFPNGANPDLATPLLSKTGLKQNAYTPAAPLAPGSYIYRVRRADADGRAGAWSSTGSFTSTGSGPTLVSPADNAEVSSKFGLFTWQPASGSAPVASWRIALARQGGSTMTVSTQATAYAPTSALADGIYTWTVSALDTDGNVIGTASRGFVVASTVTAGTVVIGGNSTVGSVITIQTLTWNVPPDSISYQWYRNNAAITTPVGAGTGSTYTVVAADVGKTIKVKVTGSKAGYTTGSGTYSNALSATAGPALVVVNAPSFGGVRRVGSTLTADPGTWSTSDSNGAQDSFAYQWLRNGGAIPGATGTTYKLVNGDAGRSLSVRVTAIKAGYPNVSATSPSGTVAKVGSATTARLAKARIKVRKHGVLYVTVTAPAGVPSSGTLRVYDGSRLIKSISLAASNGGHKTITLPLLKKGPHYLSVRYLGNAQLNPSTSARVKLRVVR